MVKQSQKCSSNSNNKYAVSIVCILLALAVFALFGRTYGYGFLNFDDNYYFSSNYHVKAGLTWAGVKWAFHTGYASNWHPLTWLSLMLDAQLFGPGPAGPHLTNVILHAANAVLLFLLVKRLTGVLWPSAFVAAMFAIHPLRVESVAWVSERKDVLSGLFFMLTLLMYARYVEQSKVQSPKPKLFYGLTLLFFALGLMSKPMLVTLPFVLLLLDYWPLNRFGHSTPNSQLSTKRVLRLVLEKLPFFVLSIVSCIATVMAQQQVIQPMAALPLTLRLDNALVSYVTYLVQMVWPENLAMCYPYRFDLPDWQVAGAGALLLCITLLAFQTARRFPCFLTGWLWYLGMFVPVIGLVQVGEQAHADRYTYLPQIGLYLIVAWAAVDWTASGRWRRQVVSAAALSATAALMFCAWKQTSYWQNDDSLWEHAIACTSGNYTAHNDLGYVLAAQGRTAEAIEHFQKALEICPDCAEADNNLGTIFLNRGRLDEAAEYYHRALDIYPSFAEAHNNMGILLAKQGRTSEAIKQYQKAIELDPDRAEMYNNLGKLLVTQGRITEAIEQFQKALEIKPDFAAVHDNWGNALVMKGRNDEAAKHYLQALQLNPDFGEAHNGLGALLLAQGRTAEALEHFRKAVELMPNNAEVQINFGTALAAQGQTSEAIQCYKKAIDLEPDYAKAHYNLANIFAAQGKLDEAIEHYQQAVNLVPDLIPAHYQLGVLLQSRGKFAAAIAQFRKILELDPRHVAAQNNLAWLLATCPEASLRDGNKAVELARQAVQLSTGGSPEILDTLAAAYAEAGQFPEAVGMARRAMDLSIAKNNRPLADAIQTQLKLYEANLPYREEKQDSFAK
jgi:tetratricopeptide (TPR) repeat protein